MMGAAATTIALGAATLGPLIACAAPEADRVPSLPGWEGKPLSPVYSGFISAGSDVQNGVHYDMQEWYMYIEAETPSDKLIVWTNGGPGASSLFGLMTELGPYYLSDESLRTESFRRTGVPTLFENKHAWTKQADLVILNSPPPIGFSYCNNNVSGDGYSCGDWDDERTAKHNNIFMENFFESFPELKTKELYIIGESYAGVYVPTLAREIVKAGKLNLKGFAVGDPCCGTEVACGGGFGPYYDLLFFFGHGQISNKQWNQIHEKCSDKELKYGITSNTCQAAYDHAMTQVGGYYGYDLYDMCNHSSDFSAWSPRGERRYWGPPSLPSWSYTRDPAAISNLNTDGSLPCGGPGAMNVWQASEHVRKALHIPKGAVFFNADNGDGFNYESTEPNLLPFYKFAATQTSLNVLVYNGDADPGLNSFQTQNWTRFAGIDEKEEWRPWTLTGQDDVAGYVTEYDAKGRFAFLSIRGAGHMVPEYRGHAASVFLHHYLTNTDYPRYVPAN